MADSIVSDITVRVLEFLGQSAVERIAPYFGGKRRLNELQLTMEMIQARLFDAERRQEVEDGALIRSWLKGLKRVMYRLEDLLEEVTMADQHDEQRASSELNKVVCFFPPKFRLLKMNKRLFYEAQDIMELDHITSNMNRFHFNVRPIDQERGALNMVSRREETYSFIREEEVIGREEDKKANTCLRLGEPYYERLPDSIGELKHLRYLKARVTSDYLPSGVTKLHYLETLDLGGSTTLRELPPEFYKLTRLKCLQIGNKFGDRLQLDCKLVDMPPRFGELISLQSLDTFVVGNTTGLDALSRLNLASELEIFYKVHRQNAISEAKQANMKGKKLTVLYLTFDCWLFYPHRESVVEADELLECLELPSTLKHLKVRNWKGVRFPNWGIDELPNLISLEIINCSRCRHLPPFDRLPHIKKLVISGCQQLDLWDIKHEEDDREKGNYVNSSSWACMKSLDSLCLGGISELESLPSGIFGLTALQNLSIGYFDDLKTIPESIGQLTQLRCLEIHWCPKLEALPKSIQNLIRLQELSISACPLLKPRCQKRGGEDWALIQHIPRKSV
ncbi:hypothetical protein Cgig2_017578 [Carnegiea gigantea]|uniref:Rx N-terminal domain-containing protein n=1 Tax=Carnegiea gigantea TaxID=171969 RepID=A0A9Q1KNP4_9CARY|nr:hypothetical protein Cgig2_017578 [Carnegiea gigantea]